MKIGLMLPMGDDEVLGRPAPFQELRDLAIAADESGLDSVWAADHVMFRGDDGSLNGIHECWTILSAIAAVTRRVEIGPLVLATPFRNPALTAKMAATLDEVSNGRLILGLGCGWHDPEFEAFGIGFDHPVSRFEEALAIILPMLRDGTASHNGRWYSAKAAPLLPPGPRPGGPPILIAGKRPRMMRLVAKHADMWNAAWYGPPETAGELRERVTRLHEVLLAEGRDPSSLALTAGVFVSFPSLLTPDREEPPKNAMAGTPEEVGRMLGGFAELGMEHLICHLWPGTPEAVRQLAEAAEVARSAAVA